MNSAALAIRAHDLTRTFGAFTAVDHLTFDVKLGEVVLANADCAGRQEVDGRFRATSGIATWHGEMIDGAAPAVPPTAASLAGTVSRRRALRRSRCSSACRMIESTIDMKPM